MADLNEAEIDDIRAFVENEDGGFPELADLPAWWDALASDARDPKIFPTIERVTF